MVKYPVKYVDFDGNEQTETLQFNMTRAELMEMELATDGGIQHLIEEIQETNDGYKVMMLIKDLVLRAYGEKTADGKRFYKNQQMKEAFQASEAYSQFLTDLATDADKLAEFFNHLTVAGKITPAEGPTLVPDSVK